MPTYEYKCSESSCNHQFEAMQSITANPLKACPICGGFIRRLIGGGTGIIFKGSGFYVTDSKSKKSSTNDKNQKKSSKENKQKGSNNSKKADSKSDSNSGDSSKKQNNTKSDSK